MAVVSWPAFSVRLKGFFLGSMPFLAENVVAGQPGQTGSRSLGCHYQTVRSLALAEQHPRPYSDLVPVLLVNNHQAPVSRVKAVPAATVLNHNFQPLRHGSDKLSIADLLPVPRRCQTLSKAAYPGLMPAINPGRRKPFHFPCPAWRRQCPQGKGSQTFFRLLDDSVEMMPSFRVLLSSWPCQSRLRLTVTCARQGHAAYPLF